MFRTPVFTNHMAMISYFIISRSKQFRTYLAVITSKLFSSCTVMATFLWKCFFITNIQYSYLLRIAVINLLTSFLSSVKSNWSGRSISNTHSFIRKSARNMLLIFFGIRSIAISTSSLHSTFRRF